MASESTDVTVSLPPDLEAWLDQQAADLGVDREAVLVQLLASYRAADELDDGAVADPDLVEPAVRSVVTDRVPDIAEAVEKQLDDGGTEALEARLGSVEDDFQEKIEDVRQRVIQVKREADAKASAEHTHEEIDTLDDRIGALEARVGRFDEELDRLGEIETELDGVESQLAELRGRTDDTATESDLDGLADQLDDAQEKLQTVAWVIRDLREKYGSSEGTTVEAIKRSAAEHDLTRARCENCGDGVEVGLLTEPSCPHCDTALSGLEPSSRIFGLGSAKLTVAPGIEAGGEKSDDEIAEISTDTPGGQP